MPTSYLRFCPVYTPISKNETRQILGLSEAEYRRVTRGGLLAKSVHFDARVSDETGAHSLADIVSFALHHQLTPSFGSEEALIDWIEYTVDLLCEIHEAVESDLPEVSVWRRGEYGELLTWALVEDMVDESQGGNYVRYGTLTEFALSVWLRHLESAYRVLDGEDVRLRAHKKMQRRGQDCHVTSWLPLATSPERHFC